MNLMTPSSKIVDLLPYFVFAGKLCGQRDGIEVKDQLHWFGRLTNPSPPKQQG